MSKQTVTYNGNTYRVIFSHKRHMGNEKKLRHTVDIPKGAIAPRGGRTHCAIVNDQGHFVATGIANCSRKDNFNAKMGRMISMGRAMKALEMGLPTWPYDLRSVDGEVSQ